MDLKLSIFVGGLIAGILSGYGIPSIKSIISSGWNLLADFLLYFLPPDLKWPIFAIGLIITLIIILLFIDPLIRALAAGIDVVIIISLLLAGFLGGILFTYAIKFEYFILALIVIALVIGLLKK